MIMKTSSTSAVRLSCERCRRSKKKCDKQSPCSACVHAGVECSPIERARRPRGRNSKHNSDGIDTRVARLEGLVNQLKAQLHTDQEGSAESEETPSHGMIKSDSLEKFVATAFWETLSEEVAGIRDVLETEDDEDINDDLTTSSQYDADSTASIPRTLLFAHSQQRGESVPPLTKPMTSVLFNVYQARVDPIIKILHWPSTIADLENDNSKVGNPIKRAKALCLRRSICFTALCTMTESEIETDFGYTKSQLLRQLRVSAEASLSENGLLERLDLAILQAFVIYLAGLRCCDSSAMAWSLLSIAVRLATSMSLGSEHKLNTLSAYDLEIRRRLWFSIGVLDTQLALDRGSLPLLQCKDFEIPPHTINDSDMYLGSYSDTLAQSFTDMSFSAMSQRAMLCQKKLHEVNPVSSNPWGEWNDKMAAITVFENYVQQNLGWINDSSRPIERFTKAVAYTSVKSIQLMLRRPPFKTESHKIPPWDKFDVMKASKEILAHSLDKRATTDFQPWTWFAWVQWYALAVLLAELCSATWSPDAEHAYVVAQKTFEDLSPLVADSEVGMLWRPIVKLMRRVQQLRGNSPLAVQNSGIANTHGSNHGNVTRSGQEALHDGNDNFQASAKLVESLLPQQLNFVPTNHTMASNLQSGFNGHDENDQMQFDALSWVNWDAFLSEMNIASGMDWTQPL